MPFPTDHFLGRQRNGLNHVSMNLSGFDRVNGPVQGTDYPVYSNQLLDWYQSKHVESVRLLITWEAIQSTLGGPVPSPDAGYATYWADLIDVLKRLLARGIYVIVGPWQYNANISDTDIVYDSAAFTSAQFSDFWGKFAAAINAATGSDQRVAFDLINEPHLPGNGSVGITLANWFAYAQSAINAIRAAGAANTVFIPGMDYAAAATFTTNGSSAQWLTLADPSKNIAASAHCYLDSANLASTAIVDACSAFVSWARTNGAKVNIAEIAINAGPNGRAKTCSNFAAAQAQWSNWTTFCAANNDVLVGWNWWGNSEAGWWNEGDSCDPQGYHWGLTLDDGVTQTIYMNLIQSSIPVPILYIRDSLTDIGAEPDLSIAAAWESPDIWVRQTADGVLTDESILGGSPAVIYVSVTNRGAAPYNGDGNDKIRVLWAKASAGLSWPAPWDASNPKMGGAAAAPQAIGPIASGKSQAYAIPWPSVPNPVDYGGDGHFCLLASIGKPTTPAFDGFAGSDLNQNVLNWSKVAWHNIHIVPVAMRSLGDIVLSNYTAHRMISELVFEILDEHGRPAPGNAGALAITPRGIAIERLRQHGSALRSLKDEGNGVYRILAHAPAISHLELHPHDTLPFALSYTPSRPVRGFAVRVMQFALDGGTRRVIGGQTFVAGEVAGFTRRSARMQT